MLAYEDSFTQYIQALPSFPSRLQHIILPLWLSVVHPYRPDSGVPCPAATLQADMEAALVPPTNEVFQQAFKYKSSQSSPGLSMVSYQLMQH